MTEGANEQGPDVPTAQIPAQSPTPPAGMPAPGGPAAPGFYEPSPVGTPPPQPAPAGGVHMSGALAVLLGVLLLIAGIGAGVAIGAGVWAGGGAGPGTVRFGGLGPNARFVPPGFGRYGPSGGVGPATGGRTFGGESSGAGPAF